jgi:glycosyltransferase involved in cell wall biosynthesis
VEKKNVFNLIRAISGLDIKLVIFGSGPLIKDLEDFSRRLNVNTEFKGNIPNKDLARELNKSKVFVLPSLYEGCPKVLLEAMACGLPVIGTNVYGTAEIIKHKENGYLCKTDSASMKKAIIEVLNDKELQERMKINARKTILQNFSFEKIIKKEIDVYKSI